MYYIPNKAVGILSLIFSALLILAFVILLSIHLFDSCNDYPIAKEDDPFVFVGLGLLLFFSGIFAEYSARMREGGRKQEVVEDEDFVKGEEDGQEKGEEAGTS